MTSSFMAQAKSTMHWRSAGSGRGLSAFFVVREAGTLPRMSEVSWTLDSQELGPQELELALL